MCFSMLLSAFVCGIGELLFFRYDFSNRFFLFWVKRNQSTCTHDNLFHPKAGDILRLLFISKVDHLVDAYFSRQGLPFTWCSIFQARLTICLSLVFPGNQYEEVDNIPLVEDYLNEEGNKFTAQEESHWNKLMQRGHDTFNKCQRRHLSGLFGDTRVELKPCSRNATLYEANYDILPISTEIKNCYKCLNYTVSEK